METAGQNLAVLGIDPAKVPVVTRDQVKYAKPDSDLFLTAADRLGVDIRNSLVLGDSIWDMIAAQRARDWVCSPATTARRNFYARVPSAFMRILRICSPTSMRLRRATGGDAHPTPAVALLQCSLKRRWVSPLCAT
jgi:beta-phosphoglucomutase-like phosphatase (HAD superfamily)